MTNSETPQTKPDHPGGVAVITGASAGVGKATALHFAGRGMAVGLLARDPDALKATRHEIEAAGGSALDLPVDVARAEAVEEAAREVESTLGPIDVWVNNAMVSVFSPFVEMAAEDFDRVTEVTYLGAVNGSRAALRHMQSRGQGCIVQVGSALAFRGIPLQSAYCGAKHALQGFTESLRCELLHDGSGIHVTSVHLPALNTPQFSWVKAAVDRHPQPVPPIFQPELAAAAIWHASRSRRRHWYVGGPTLMTVAGNKLMPGLIDRYLARTGFSSQLTDEPISPDRPDNLRTSVPGVHSVRGKFDDRAKARSLQYWASRRRLRLALAATGGLLGGLGLRKLRN